MRARFTSAPCVVTAALLAIQILLVSEGWAASERQHSLNRSGIENTHENDARGLSTLRETRRRTPSGLLYPYPAEPATWRGDSVLIRGFVELGYVGNFGETDEARFRKYSDWSDGLLVPHFLLEGKRSDRADSFQLSGGSVGREDQSYGLEVGRTGLWRLRASYDAVRHVYADDARILFSGTGSEYLSIPPGLALGASPASEIQSALSSVRKSRLSQQRNESGIELSLRILPDLTITADYRLRRRSGERLFGGTLGPTFGAVSGGSVLELTEPIRSKTHDWTTRIAYATPRLQTNLRIRGSYYDNARTSLTWENPFPAFDFGGTIIPGPLRGRSALAPDNHLYQVAGDVGIRLPLRGHFSGSAAWTRMRQNQTLLPATITPTITAFANPSRSRADARVDQLVIRSKLSLRPVRRLGLQARFRFFRRDSDTHYRALDRVSGDYGYVTEDVAPINRVGAPSFSYSRWSGAVKADWKITRHATVGSEYEHEETRRENRARRLVRDNKVRLYFSTRGLSNSTLR